MIDNLTLVKPLLTFPNEGDFYMLYIMKRKKDQSTDKSNHQSVRTIKSYCIQSIDYLEERYDEIKELCEYFKARAYMYIERRNHKDVGLAMIETIARKEKSNQSNHRRIWDSTVAHVKRYEKRFVVDVDTRDPDEIYSMLAFIEHDCNPYGKDKLIQIIETNQGCHFITEPFNLKEFKDTYDNVDVGKNSPTLLYFPDSIDT